MTQSLFNDVCVGGVISSQAQGDIKIPTENLETKLLRDPGRRRRGRWARGSNKRFRKHYPNNGQQTCRSSRMRPDHAGEAEDLERIRIKGGQKVRGDYKCNFRYSFFGLEL